MESLLLVFMCAAIIGLYFFRYRVGYPSKYSLLPFQRGLLFRRGRPVREVGPGRHRVFLGSEKILFLDVRPIEFKVEQRAVGLADGGTAVYGFATSAEIRDVKKAMYASASYSQLPAFVSLCVTRATLGRCKANDIRTAQAALSEEITEACRTRLAAAGFDLLSFRFSELAVAPVS